MLKWTHPHDWLDIQLTDTLHLFTTVDPGNHPACNAVCSSCISAVYLRANSKSNEHVHCNHSLSSKYRYFSSLDCRAAPLCLLALTPLWLNALTHRYIVNDTRDNLWVIIHCNKHFWQISVGNKKGLKTSVYRVGSRKWMILSVIKKFVCFLFHARFLHIDESFFSTPYLVICHSKHRYFLPLEF